MHERNCQAAYRASTGPDSWDELWKMTGDSLPEHETFFFYFQRISNYRTLLQAV
jgi:hypothetical protein